MSVANTRTDSIVKVVIGKAVINLHWHFASIQAGQPVGSA